MSPDGDADMHLDPTLTAALLALASIFIVAADFAALCIRYVREEDARFARAAIPRGWDFIDVSTED